MLGILNTMLRLLMIALGLLGFIHFPIKQIFSSTFQLFEKVVERQFSARIKCVQTDGGGAFKSYWFQKHLSQTGILQQMSCPYTLEQNGVVERRHRSIVEVGLSQPYHCKIPYEF